MDRQYLQPHPASRPCWDTSRLSYGVEVAAPAEGGGQLRLSADRYSEGRLDWHSFRVDAGAPALSLV